MKRLPINVMNFSAGRDTKLYEAFEEYYNAYVNGKASIGNVSFAEADKDILDAYKKEIEVNSGMKMENFASPEIYCNFTQVKEVGFAIVGMLVDLVLPDSLIKDLGYIADIKPVGFGDSLKIDLKPRDIFVVSKGGRGKRSFDIKRQYNGTKTIVPENRVISVGISLYDVLTGKYTLAEFVMKAVQSIEVNMRYDIYDAFAAAMSGLSATSGAGQLRVSGYTQDTAIELAQKVQAWNGGKPAIFLGTKLALSKILPSSTNYRFNLGDEYVSLGHIRDFFGFNCVELEQIADYSTEFGLKLPNDKIFIISPTADKLVKVATEGSTLTNVAGQYANADLRQEANIIKSWGTGVATSAIAGMIELN